MENIDIDSLFDHDRFPSGALLFPVLIYFPIGILLAILRLFIGLHAFLICCLLPKTNAIRRFVIRVMCTVLGIWVKHEDSDSSLTSNKVLVANYTSSLDHLAVDLVIPSVLPCVWDLPNALMWMLGYRDMGAKKGRETLIQNAKRHCEESDLPLLVFPEGASTNGKAGLLKFSIWPFSLDQPVLPLIIDVHRPTFVKVSPSILGGRWWIDLFWFLFVPYTFFRIRTLPAEVQDDSETVEEFTLRVQGVMAKAMSIQPTPHTSADKVEYAKRKLFIPPTDSTQATPARPTQPNFSRDPVVLMTNQVKEVLPHVPAAAIQKDLMLTKDVDLTITNILEGRVQFTPEEPGTEATPAVSPPKNMTPASTSAKSFGKSTRERQMSFEERKQALYENARLKYMEKHGML